jgi:hypothetical protein
MPLQGVMTLASDVDSNGGAHVAHRNVLEGARPDAARSRQTR